MHKKVVINLYSNHYGHITKGWGLHTTAVTPSKASFNESGERRFPANGKRVEELWIK